MLRNFTGADHVDIACGYTDRKRSIIGRAKKSRRPQERSPGSASDRGLLQAVCMVGRHGKNQSNSTGLGFRPRCGSSVRTASKYRYGSRPFALAVSTNVYTMAIESAPFVVSQNNQFSRPTAKGRMAFPAKLLEMSTSGCSKKAFKYSFWFLAQVTASASLHSGVASNFSTHIQYASSTASTFTRRCILWVSQLSPENLRSSANS